MLMVRRRRVMLGQYVAPEIALEVSPNRVDVVRVVLDVVVLDDKRRTLDPIVVPCIGVTHPSEHDVVKFG